MADPIPKRCPYCDGSPKLSRRRVGRGSVTRAQFLCPACGMAGPEENGSEAALYLWNELDFGVRRPGGQEGGGGA